MTLLLISTLTFIAAVIGTITGFGTSTVMIPILMLWMPPIETIFLVSIIHWFGNLWRIALFRQGVSWRLVLLFGVTGMATSYGGALISLGTHTDLFFRGLGLFLTGYSLFLIVSPRFNLQDSNSIAMFGGALSGFFAGVFGIGGAIRGLFLSVFDLPKAVYIATGAVIGLLVDSSRIVTYVWGGAQLPRPLSYGLLAFVPVSLIGAAFAKKIVDYIPQARFRMVVAFFLLAMGIKWVLFGL